MVLVTSLLELNSGSLAMKRIMRIVTYRDSQEKSKVVLQKYKKLYGNTHTQFTFKHIESDIEDKKLPEEYHEIILETGFYIYYLILYYSQLDMQEIDQETSNEFQIVKYNKEDENLFMDNIVDQLIRFSYQKVGGILGLINKIRKYLQKKLREKNKITTCLVGLGKRQLLKRNYDTGIFREKYQVLQKILHILMLLDTIRSKEFSFFQQPYCKYLPQETKKEFHETVKKIQLILRLLIQQIRLIQLFKFADILKLWHSFSLKTNLLPFLPIMLCFGGIWHSYQRYFQNVFIILFYSAITPSGNNSDDYQRVSYHNQTDILQQWKKVSKFLSFVNI